MGNRQTAQAGALVLQYPNGRTQRMYWSVTAGEVMQMNPGHYVSLPASVSYQSISADDQTVVSFTGIKLLRSHESLLLGNAYRLVTTQEVMNVIREKYGKMKKHRTQSTGRLQHEIEPMGSNNGRVEQGNHQPTERKNHAHRSRSIFARSKSWRPSFRSISEAGI